MGFGIRGASFKGDPHQPHSRRTRNIRYSLMPQHTAMGLGGWGVLLLGKGVITTPPDPAYMAACIGIEYSPILTVFAVSEVLRAGWTLGTHGTAAPRV